MTAQDIKGLTDAKAVLTVFRSTKEERKSTPLSMITGFKKVDPNGFASLAADCRQHLLEELS